MQDVYYVLDGPVRAEHKVKRSRFIAEAMPVEDEAQAEAEIAAIRKQAYDATHHCFAYRVGAGGEGFRYSDDGEPSGTAGAPILRQVDARGLTNTLVVVTRYYGGTKLGTGGLIRAYGEVTAEALDAARIEEKVLRTRVRLCFGYEDTSPAMHTLSQFDAEVYETHYTDATEIIIGVRRSQAALFIETFVDALRGRGRAEVMTERPLT